MISQCCELKPAMKEKQIINLIKKSISPEAASLIGDDCAFLDKEGLLVSTDALVEGVHFRADIDPYFLGWKTVAVNISDIAAMGGIPQYFVLAASLPQSSSDQWIEKFLQGVNECCEQYETLLIGGDLTGSDKIYLCGTVMGSLLDGKLAKRSFAKAGHKIIATGSFGDSAAGLKLIEMNEAGKYLKLLEAHVKPIPKVKEGLKLVELSRSPVSMMDSSDGLLDCLQQISQQSKVRLKVDFAKIPVSSNLLSVSTVYKLDLQKLVLLGGEDYQLVATTDSDFDEQVWTCIGEVVNGEGVEIYNEGKLIDLNSFKIFDHFC
jgi:thiamine-monophosphate kinase